jgi:histidyl-tRNA synthetase
MASPGLKAPRGTRDLTGDLARGFAWMEATFRAVAARAGYDEIRTPLFESTDLFVRGVGEATDIVGKEMYTFQDRKGRSLTLRPEGTAPVVRAVLEGGLLAPGALLKMFYIGPMFRYDRPQAGRYRQFHQVGVELFGSAHPAADADVIALSVDMLDAFGLRGAEVLVNSVGDAVCRPLYEERIREVLLPHAAELCPDCQARLATRPLRVLDCKNPACAALARTVPPLRESLCDACAAHFRDVLALLAQLEIRHRVADELVRGLDYYTRTVFEVHGGRTGAQSALFGGGRYDGLVEALGGPATPAVGYAAGIDRMLLAVEETGVCPWRTDRVDVALVVMQPSPELRAHALVLARALRRDLAAFTGRACVVEVDVANRSSAAQMKWANKTLDARFAVLLGPDEVARGEATIKDMTQGDQASVTAGALARALAERLATAGADQTTGRTA